MKEFLKTRVGLTILFSIVILLLRLYLGLEYTLLICLTWIVSEQTYQAYQNDKSKP